MTWCLQTINLMQQATHPEGYCKRQAAETSSCHPLKRILLDIGWILTCFYKLTLHENTENLVGWQFKRYQYIRYQYLVTQSCAASAYNFGYPVQTTTGFSLNNDNGFYYLSYLPYQIRIYITFIKFTPCHGFILQSTPVLQYFIGTVWFFLAILLCGTWCSYFPDGPLR